MCAKRKKEEPIVTKDSAVNEHLNDVRMPPLEFETDVMLDAQFQTIEADSKDQQALFLADKFQNLSGFSLNKNGTNGFKKLLETYSLKECWDGIRTSFMQYVKYDKDENATSESVEIVLEKVGRICYVKRQEKEDPSKAKLYYIRGILRNRFTYFDDRLGMKLMQEALEYNADIEKLEEYSKNARNWSSWREGLEDFIEKQKEEFKKSAEERPKKENRYFLCFFFAGDKLLMPYYEFEGKRFDEYFVFPHPNLETCIAALSQQLKTSVEREKMINIGELSCEEDETGSIYKVWCGECLFDRHAVKDGLFFEEIDIMSYQMGYEPFVDDKRSLYLIMAKYAYLHKAFGTGVKTKFPLFAFTSLYAPKISLPPL